MINRELLIMRYIMQYDDTNLQMNDNNVNNTTDQSMTAHVRVLHSATRSPDVDVHVNDNPVATNLKYREFTEYLELPSGTYNFKVYRAGDNSKPLVDVDAYLAPNSISTLAAHTDVNALHLNLVEEKPLYNSDDTKAKIRAVHHVENTPPVDLLIIERGHIFETLDFTDIADYIEIPPGTYTFELRLADTDIPLLYVPNATLNDGNYYSVYLIGLLNDFHELQVLIPLDGLSYINKKK